MAALFKKKKKKPQEGQPPSQAEGGFDVPPPSPSKKKKSLFGRNAPKPPKRGKQKRPKGGKKAFQGKKSGEMPSPPPQSGFVPPEVEPAGITAPEAGPQQTAPDSPAAATQGEPSGRLIIGKKGPRGPKNAKNGQMKPPGKPKAGKKKAPKSRKKSVFSRGKKKSRAAVLGRPPVGQATSPTTAGQGMPQQPAGLPTEMPPAAPGTQEKPAKKHLFGKKEQKGPKPRKVPKQKKQKSGGLGGSKTSAVGLDLGRTSVCAVRMRHQTGGAAMLSVALDNLPPGLIEEGEVKDVDGLAFALKDFWKTHKIKGRKVSLGIANQKVVVRTLEFPMLGEKELRSAIEFQAQDYIPIPLEEAAFDFHVLGEVMSEDGIQKQRVLVVAAQKFMVMDFINAVKKAKLVVDSVDLQAFAMLRSMAISSFLEVEGERKEALAIANIASDVTNIVVTTSGEPQFTRIVAFGGDNFTKAVQDLQGVSFNEAELLKAQAGLSAPGTGQTDERMGYETGKTEETDEGNTKPWPEDAGIEGEGPEGADTTGQPGEVAPGETGPQETTPPKAGTEGVAPGETGSVAQPESEGGWPEAPPDIESPEEIMTGIMRAMEITADALAEEIRRSLDYYMSQEQSVPISKLVLSGGGAMLNNLDLHLAQVFPFPVEIGNPLTRVTLNRSDLSDDELRALAPRLAIAIGLALEDEE